MTTSVGPEVFDDWLAGSGPPVAECWAALRRVVPDTARWRQLYREALRGDEAAFAAVYERLHGTPPKPKGR